LKIITWTKTKTAVIAGATVLLSVATFTGVEKAVHAHTDARGKAILQKVVAANRHWLVGPPDTVTKYRYVFHLDWKEAPGGVQHIPVQVDNPAIASPSARQGITYVSLLQRLAAHPDQVQVRGVSESDGKIKLTLIILPIPGSKTTYVENGKRHSLPPLDISCGNGIKDAWRGGFNTGGSEAELVLDAAKMVPLHSVVKVPPGRVEESFSDFAQAGAQGYVPLSVAIKWHPKKASEITEYAWKFKLHDGLWLFDQSEYRGVKVCWTDQVIVN